MHEVLPITIHELYEVMCSRDENDRAFIECLRASIGAWRTGCAPEMVRRVGEAMRGEMVRRTRLEMSEN